MTTDKVLALAREAGLAVTISSYDSLYKFAALLQREWVGLTDDEVYNALPGYPIDYRLEFYRAIEAKLKEKNG